MHAYGQVKARTEPVVHMVRDRPVMTLDSAIDRVSAMLGVTLDWMELRDFPAAPMPSRGCGDRRWLPASSPRWNWRGWAGRKSRQEEIFGPLHLRRVKADA